MPVRINNDDLIVASSIMNRMLKDGTVKTFIYDMPPQLDYSNVESKILVSYLNIYGDSFTPEITLYKPWWRWSKAYARTYTGDFNKIELNARRLNRSLPSIVGTIAHEWGHCFESYVKTQVSGVFFNHGDNNPRGKDNTFQYQLGRRVKLYVQENLDELIRDIRG